VDCVNIVYSGPFLLRGWTRNFDGASVKSVACLSSLSARNLQAQSITPLRGLAGFTKLSMTATARS